MSWIEPEPMSTEGRIKRAMFAHLAIVLSLILFVMVALLA